MKRYYKMDSILPTFAYIFNFLFYFHIHLIMMWSFMRTPFLHDSTVPSANTDYLLLTLFIAIGYTPILFDLSPPEFYRAWNSKQRIRGHYLLLYAASVAFCLLDWVEWWICWPYPTIVAWFLSVATEIILYCYSRSVSKM